MQVNNFNMKVRIISPEKRIYSSDEALEIYVPTTSGTIGVLADHENLISILQIGEVKVKTSKATDTILINGGVLEVKDNEVILLTEDANLPHEIIKEETEKAIRMAEEKLASNPPSTELVMLEKQLRYQRFKQSKVQL